MAANLTKIPKNVPQPKLQGEKHHAAMLTEELVAWARDMVSNHGMTIRECATYLERPYATVWDAVNYNTWKHLRDS